MVTESLRCYPQVPPTPSHRRLKIDWTYYVLSLVILWLCSQPHRNITRQMSETKDTFAHVTATPINSYFIVIIFKFHNLVWTITIQFHNLVEP